MIFVNEMYILVLVSMFADGEQKYRSLKSA